MKNVFIGNINSDNIVLATTKELAERIMHINNYLYYSSEVEAGIDLNGNALKVDLIESEDEIPKLPVGVLLYGFVEYGYNDTFNKPDFNFHLCNLSQNPDSNKPPIFIYDEDRLNNIMPKFTVDVGTFKTVVVVYFDGAIRTKENESVEEFRNRKYEYFKEEFEKFKKENPKVIENMRITFMKARNRANWGVI